VFVVKNLIMMGCGFHFPWFFFLIIGLQAPLSLSLTSQG